MKFISLNFSFYCKPTLKCLLKFIARLVRASSLQFLLAVNRSFSSGCYKNMVLDKAWSRKLVAATRFITCYSRNNIVAIKSWSTAVYYTKQVSVWGYIMLALFNTWVIEPSSFLFIRSAYLCTVCTRSHSNDQSFCLLILRILCKFKPWNAGNWIEKRFVFRIQYYSVVL